MNSRMLALLVLLLLASPFAWAGDAFHGKLPPASSDREFQVLAAQWGQGHRWADVTEKACELSTEAGLDVAANRWNFGDPYPHFKKSLVVFYLWRGELYSATAREHGRLRIPPTDDRAAALRSARIAREFEAEKTAACRRIDEAVATGTIDAIQKAVRKNRRAAKKFARRMIPDLERDVTGLRARIGHWRKRSRRAVKAMREVPIRVSSTSDWRDLEVEIGEGDLVFFCADGRWKLGSYAGTCDSAGFPGERYRSSSLIDELPHGCLLVRLGSVVFGPGRRSGAIRATEGGVRVAARCNDKTYRDNSGSITVRVLVVPATDGTR